MKTLLFLIPIVALLSACISVDCGYAPNVDITEHTEVTPSQRVPISFSIEEVECFRNDFFFTPTREELSEKLKEALEETQLFSEVRYLAKPEKSLYHIVFRFHISGETEGQAVLLGLTAGYTLCLIPVWEDLTFDGAAIVYLRNEPLYASGSAELMKIPIWLPFAPVGIFWNNAVGWHYTTKGVVNNLVNDVTDFHAARFNRPRAIR